MTARRALALALLAAPMFAAAQAPLRYTIRVDVNDRSTIHVEMRIPASSDTLRLAMARHDEYDDRYWRYVRDLTAESSGAALGVEREDSAVWRVFGASGDVTVRYRIALPVDSTDHPRRSWKSFLESTGGLVGSIDCLMYIPGRTALPATLTLDIPAGWGIATGLEHTADPNAFRAADAATLLDSPILIGRLRTWTIHHANVAFLEAPNTVPFDTVKFLDITERITDQAVAIFGAPPYGDYTFLLQDDAGDALEHINSLVLGVSSADLAKDPAEVAPDIAHEFFHTWNLIRLHPVGLRALRTAPTPQVGELWWSEGVTIFFAEELRIRARVYPPNSTRVSRLAARIEQYLGNPGYTHVSPERASLTVGMPPGTNGDYSGDYYLSGQLVGDLLELIIRDSTNGARGMDQVIATLYKNAAGEPGYTRADIERAANSVCGCELRPFFERHVRIAAPFDFDGMLRSIGYRTDITWDTAHDGTGAPLPDRRVYVTRPETAPPSSPLAFAIIRPTGAWARAGLHSGDALISVNGRAVATSDEFRHFLSTLRVGQHVSVAYARDGRRAKTDVMMDVYVLPKVTLVALPDPTPHELARRAAWLVAQ